MMKKVLLLLILSLSLVADRPRVLHMTMHRGCQRELEYVADQLEIDLETYFVHDVPAEGFDGKTVGSARYNLGERRAGRIWEINKEYFESFDIIVTSDTAPLARIFLQNNYSKPLIIWVCNRFDYADRASLDCAFPDKKFYDLFRSIPERPNVQIFSYTAFEHYYAQHVRKVFSWNEVIKPSGGLARIQKKSPSLIPTSVVKEESFFIPPYHNDTIFLDLSKKLSQLGIPNYRGRYAGPSDLKDFKGIVHIPYAWSNLALFENWSNGVIYFIPSKAFLLKLAGQSRFFWSPPFIKRALPISEWYDPAYRDLFVYFDSWEDLAKKAQMTDYDAMRQHIKAFAERHHEETLEKWRRALDVF